MARSEDVDGVVEGAGGVAAQAAEIRRRRRPKGHEMLTDKQVIAFKIAARARKMANEDCLIEGFEILETAISEAARTGDEEMADLLRLERDKFEKKFVAP